MIIVFDVYGNNYKIEKIYHDYFIERQFRWGIVSKEEHETGLLEEFAEELIEAKNNP